jgi:hypothetical protein
MSVSEDVLELRVAFADSLERLAVLVENRSAWADGIEGCREALVMMTEAADKLKAIGDAAGQLEFELVGARAESETWSKNHAELCVVERQLRAECEQSRAELKRLKAETRSWAKRLTSETAA